MLKNNPNQKPIQNVSELWEEKTGLPWSEARAQGLTDGSLENNLTLQRALQKREMADKIPYVQDQEIEELKILVPKDERVRKQSSYIKKGGDTYTDNLPYTIVDKGQNRMYVFDEDHTMLGAENVITGKDNFDEDHGQSMRDWLSRPENVDKNQTDYFRYLAETNQQVTPSGEFRIGTHRKGVEKSPSKLRNIINSVDSFLGGTRQEDMEKARKKSYGERGELFTLVDDKGIASSKAIHGTNYDGRVEALAGDARDSAARDKSNGCININGESLCFDTLKKDSRVFIMPEQSEEIIQPKGEMNRFSQELNQMDTQARKIYEDLKQGGVDDVSFEEAKKISAIASVETKHGSGKRYNFRERLQNELGVSKSKGVYQINEEAFKDYLPENYNWRDETSQAKAVLNFIRAHPGEDLKTTYNKYNRGNASKKSKNQNKINRLRTLLKNEDFE